ncbi:MAG: hypothetical protein K2M17_03805, partial [Bacilli bacterium]|nr:hypothetical protein [Bacilli bacterium]
MNKNILYFTDDYLYLYNKKRGSIIRSGLPKNIVVNGKIANINKFIAKYETLLKEFNLNNGIIGDKLKILVHSKYTSADITLLKNVFEKLNYRNIVVDVETKYYKLQDNNAWIHAT